jgi:hypothetical protein
MGCIRRDLSAVAKLTQPHKSAISIWLSLTNSHDLFGQRFSSTTIALGR